MTGSACRYQRTMLRLTRLVGNVRGLTAGELALDLPLIIEIEPVSDTVGLLWFSPA